MSEQEQEFKRPLPPQLLSSGERLAILLLVSFLIVLSVGLTVKPEMFWDSFLKPLVWDPIAQDADAGDSGYSPQNTALFITILFASVIAISATFRIIRMPSGERMLLGFLPWVIWAPVIRVLEDSQFFADGFEPLFISPIIHLHIAAWVVVAILLGLAARKYRDYWSQGVLGEDPEGDMVRMTSLVSLILMAAVLLLPSLNTHQGVGSFGVALGFLAAVISVVMVVEATEGWHPVERSLASLGTGSVFMWLGLWLQFAITPWHQQGESALWPALVVLGIPAFVCMVLHGWGKPSAIALEEAGMEPGVLPADVSIKRHDDGSWTGRSLMERHAPKALMSTVWALTITFGQLTDGLATWIGIDGFGYGEKHPLSAFVIEQGAAISSSGGAWLFFLVKASLVGLLLWVFSAVRIEERQKHLRLFIVIALLIVGMAPGLRDLGRLLLGV